MGLLKTAFIESAQSMPTMFQGGAVVCASNQHWGRMAALLAMSIAWWVALKVWESHAARRRREATPSIL